MEKEMLLYSIYFNLSDDLLNHRGSEVSDGELLILSLRTVFVFQFCLSLVHEKLTKIVFSLLIFVAFSPVMR